MAVGMFRAFLEELGQVEFRAYGALRSMRLVLQWKPLYMSAEGGCVFAGEAGDTGKPVLINVEYRDVLRPVSLSRKQPYPTRTQESWTSKAT